jgi:hypothetical protein
LAIEKAKEDLVLQKQLKEQAMKDKSEEIKYGI